MDNKNLTVRFTFYLSTVFLLILYLFPGSLIGYFLYGDIRLQPNLISNPIGTSINHLIVFFYLSTIGLLCYLDEYYFGKVFIFLLFLSTILELFHLFIPNRAFEYLDLSANIVGVFLGYYIVIIYKKWRRNE